MQKLIDLQGAFIRCLLFFLVIGAMTLFPEIALAQGTPSGVITNQDPETGAFEIGKSRLSVAFRQTRTIIYILGGFGALTVGVMAFFGRFKWGWFWSILGGLAVIALVVEGINFAIGEDASDVFDTDYESSSGLVQ